MVFRIYAITELESGKQYVGQTTQSLRNRLHSHNDKTKRSEISRRIHSNPTGFTIRELSLANSQSEADELETQWIYRLNTGIPHGYNTQTIGGRRAPWEASTTEKMRKIRTGMRPDSATREKMSEAQRRRTDNKKLTQAKADHIRELLARGHKAKEISLIYGITARNVYSIKAGNIWKHMETESNMIVTEQHLIWAAEALRFLSGMDGDKCREQNGVGFNKVDTQIGNSLASELLRAENLTLNQWRIALSICPKYRGQPGFPPVPEDLPHVQRDSVLEFQA